MRSTEARSSPKLGRAGRAQIVVTAQPVAGQFEIRAQGYVRTFEGRRIGEPVELQLNLGRAPPQGAVIDALVVIKLPPGPKDGFDERTWLWRHGIHVVLRVDEWTQIGMRGGLGGLADRLRSRLARSIAPGLGGERRAVLEGIVLGDGSELSPGLRQDFQASGLYHILAVSGQNVVLVAAGALTLAWLLGIGRVAGELGALAGIGAYVLAVGPQPSVIRAGIAGGLASLAWLSGRLRDAWQALLVGAIVLLAWNPYNVYDPGFQLSFAAVAAIFTVVPRINRRLEIRAASANCPDGSRRLGRLQRCDGADPVAPVRLPPARGRPGERAGRARDAGPARPRVRDGSARRGRPGRSIGSRVAERLDGCLHRLLCPGPRLAPVRRDLDDARPCGARGRPPRRGLCLGAMADELKAAYLIAGTDRPKIGRAVARLRSRFAAGAVEL